MLLLIILYRVSGLIASVGMVVYLFVTLGVFYLVGGKLTLQGIAALVIGIGMAVDSAVISFSRIKEELKKKNTLRTSYENGNKQSFISILDANVTTLIAAIILFIFGESSVKGFATMLIISIIVTVVVMVFLVKFLLGLFVKSGFFDKKLGLFIGVSKKKIHKADKIDIPFQKLEFVRNQKYFLSFTALIIIVGLVLSFTRGANLGVDFTGGTTITMSVNENVTLKKVQNEIKELKYTVKKTENTESNISITIDEVLDKDSIKELASKLESEYHTDTDIYTVSKVVKQELTKNAIYSLILASIGILIYVAIRFRFNYAISAIMALVHDVTIIILFFCIFKLEITSIFIAAILTIIGYSINDTIVTFDMIRENYKVRLADKNKHIKKSKKNKNESELQLELDKEELISLVNDSVRTTFFRSILTTVTTIFPVICLMIWGAHEIFNFNVALLVGFVAGVYSSIYISNQLWLFLEIRRVAKPRKKDKDDDDDDEISELQVKGINC